MAWPVCEENCVSGTKIVSNLDSLLDIGNGQDNDCQAS